MIHNCRFTRVFILAIILKCNVLAAPAQAENTHIQSALSFADRNDWENAIPHAKRSGEDDVIKLVSWLYLRDRNSGAHFSEISRFMDKNPEWPDQSTLQVRAEFTFLEENSQTSAELLKWFEKHKPITGIGKITYLATLKAQKKGSSSEYKTLAKLAWIKGDFNRAKEKEILVKYKKYLSSQDHIDRADRLLWDGQTTAASRMKRYVPSDYQRVIDARIALAKQSRHASSKLRHVSAKLKNTPGIIYDRIRYRSKRGDDKGVQQLLITAPKTVPYPEKWWHYRSDQIRKAVAEKQYDTALKLLKNHGQKEGAGYADALWLEGWIQNEYKKAPKSALKNFKKMFEFVTYPVSKARAAYWAGRAAEKLKEKNLAHDWYKEGAKHTTSFYGQLSVAKLSKTRELSFPSSPNMSSSHRRYFSRFAPAQAYKMALQYGKADIAITLGKAIIEEHKDNALIIQLIQAAAESSTPQVAVHASRKAMPNHVLLMEEAFPIHKTPKSKPIEPALTLAITRQESAFDPRAKSRANALGMMQLLSSTAKETARKAKIRYSKSRLYEPDYNMELGSLYLERMINSYDGSYVLAIASYNAGPGNVRKWIKRFGTPNNNSDSAINWIEKIPFTETRNYVQRVLENLQVYRALEKKNPVQIERDLRR